MSLGRLLRRASSKASDLLTLNPSGSSGSPSILDGEIIYSKNNVCVHPLQVLQGLGEHHPGYLCLYMEKDELLGTTLILAWVPNSRIQRQDEEALRYITPESSPVRKVPSKRGRHTQGSGEPHQPSLGESRNPLTSKDEDILVVAQSFQDTLHINSSLEDGEKLSHGLGTDSPLQATQPVHSDSGILSAISSQDEPNRSELSVDGTEEGPELRLEPGEEEGSLELSADDVSRDSTFDSDSDAFSSPFCLSPISEALAESSSSVFLDDENRETCDNHMTCSTSSTSSLDTSLQFPENSGQLQNSKWDEQQKVFALEQICGVFRVDLGQMRSLRLFFSDEACTSGQLVVASRESQYKIFHFHHGGLDKLSEVFQQWKHCTETHLKDQVSNEKTCMQFSIRRPKLPSSETHPEENMYKKLDVSTWLNHLNESGQVEEEYKLRKAIFFGGIDVSIRGEVWPFLLRYYSHESTSEEREALRAQKRREYSEIQQKRLSMTPEEQREFWRHVQFTVDKDVVRTDRSNQFFRGEDNPNVESMRRILLNYAVYNPTIGYSQGMSDLVAPILAEVLDESDTFWCFVGLMQNTIFVSSPRDEDMEKQLLYLRELLRLTHLRFYQHLVSLGEDGLQMLFCHRWILLCFKREFPDAEALRMWEACWAHYQTDYFHLFICVAIVVIYGDDVIEQQLATDQMLLHFGNLAMHMNGELVLRKARSLLYQFRLLPRIPCSLHDLCKLCGTGMWDSGYIPAVECTGHHPESESCPYGGTMEAPSPKSVVEGKKGQKTREVFNFRK
ncbi:TBC1 domain family member 16 isoform X2 [Monodelphis domestica]|uniref:TBC1 domain family member 16 isoform X2 n=1 Tax=Monodelphis domestica TaxID=13616 RepID=UPI0024E24D81|nr:TBC1 domain family member 16 isoform X2 [Monodelphis domestica]XP_056673353.1 TBC1 domain family member 16 isoform X2 [Monodelphis domestica]XP_056673354.1 TBC1 domain family member 16 isoform X2 [Monodelphis domestica]XP_056673355.1 TBC1 domain family member 16 isoform X2 [Monodelphis domestica]